MKKIRIITIGKIKTSWVNEALAHYRKLVGRFCKLEEVFLKDSPAKLPPEERKKKEGEAILSKIGPRDFLICMDETGAAWTSREFSKKMTRWTDSPDTPCFVIGGPYGLSDEVLKKARQVLSLGPMTLPHELAKVVLYEQLYRAAAIRNGLPYHND